MNEGELCSFFDRVYVLNLPDRPDRINALLPKLEVCNWPFRDPIIYRAIHGDTVGVPDEFKQGGGAFGCRQTHVRIIEDCLMDGVTGWVLILEDDADVLPDFSEEVAKFLPLVPPDAEGIMLGGQHHWEPKPVKPGIVRVQYAQRTHCYAFKPSYGRALVSRWACSSVHVDWRMEHWQAQRHVYAPEKWLVGQAGGKSDINGRIKPPEWWTAPTGDEPVILLHCPKEILPALRRHGLHTGLDRDPATDIDMGLPSCFQGSPSNKRSKLRNWINTIQAECQGSRRQICTLWHPLATLEQLKESTKGAVYEITADTADEVIAQLPLGLMDQSAKRKECVCVFKGPKEVAGEMQTHSFHFGYWRGNDGIDNGLRNILHDKSRSEDKKIEDLKKWVSELQHEADSFNGIVTAWHPDATADLFIKVTEKPVITIEADNIEKALEQYRAGLNG